MEKMKAQTKCIRLPSAAIDHSSWLTPVALTRRRAEDGQTGRRADGLGAVALADWTNTWPLIQSCLPDEAP